MDENEGSLYRNSNLSLNQKLEKARAELLDLTARNRLLNIPKSKNTKFLEIVNERSDILFKMLYEEKSLLHFFMEKKIRKRMKVMEAMIAIQILKMLFFQKTQKLTIRIQNFRPNSRLRFCRKSY